MAKPNSKGIETVLYFRYSRNMETNSAVTGLSALAHEGRLAAFRLLVKAGGGGLAAGDLARTLKMPPSTLSANLTLLSHAGLVRSRREGRSIIYAADYDAMSALLSFLMEDCCAGSPEICAPLQAITLAAACCAADPSSPLETTI